MINKALSLDEIKVVANRRFRIKNYYSIPYRVVCTILILVSITFLMASLSIVSYKDLVWNTHSYVSISMFVFMFLLTGSFGCWMINKMSKVVGDKKKEFIKRYIETGEIVDNK